MSTSSRDVYLAQHAFVCIVGKHCVFLDLKHDEYLCLGRHESDDFARLLKNEPDNSQPLTVNLSTVSKLRKKGLIVMNRMDGKSVALPPVKPALTSLPEKIEDASSLCTPAHIRRFLVATITASINLKWHSIYRTVHAVMNYKSSYRKCGYDSDIEITEALFGAFQKMRPYYPRPYLCLFDSLALIRFLAQNGVFPLWVYGVCLEPFGAHCWVQTDSTIVNDVVDNVRRYTPIMAV